MGIALIAGIAIPAMIIGIPVYVGRKVNALSSDNNFHRNPFQGLNAYFPPQIHNRYEGRDISKHRRNLVIAGGVTLSVIVSPVVAAVTVGKK